MTAMPPLRPILNNTPASATDVDWNFQAVEDYVATDLIHRDGSVAMEAPLNLLGAPPSLPTHAITKGYLDTNGIPVGVIWQYAGATAPAGWVFCDGSPKSTTDPLYAALFAAIQYAYGGSGGTFNLPNLGGRMPVGRQVGDARFGTLNAPGGNRSLIIPNHTHPMPHVHAMADHAHNRGSHAHGIAAHQHHIAHTHTVPFRKGYNLSAANDGGENGVFKETNAVWKPAMTIPLSFTIRETAIWTGDPPGGPDYASSGISGGNNYSNFNHDGIGQATGTDGDGATSGMTAAQNTGGTGTPNTSDANGAVSPTDANLPPYVVVNFIIRIG